MTLTSGKVDVIIDVYPAATGVSSVVERQRLEVELVHGYGLGKRIQSVASFYSTPEGWDIQGTLTFGSLAEVAQFDTFVTSDTFTVNRVTLATFGPDSVLVMDISSSNPVDTGIATLNTVGKVLTSLQLPTGYSLEQSSLQSIFLDVDTLASFDAFAILEVPAEGATVFDRQSGHTSRKLCSAEDPEEQDLSSRRLAFVRVFVGMMIIENNRRWVY